VRRTTLGSTGLEVSRICIGTWQFSGDWGGIERDEAFAAVRRARDLGVNIFDTAQAYGWGESERALGEALRDDLNHRREEVLIATKGGLRRGANGLVRDSSRAWLRKGVEESLRNLGVDYVDLYQVHWPDPAVPIEETVGTLDELIHEGAIRFAGVSNFSVDEMERFNSRRRLDSNQPPYHLFRRDIERDVLPWCGEHQVGVLVWGVLAHGLLTGKFDAETTFAEDDWRSRSDLFRGEPFRRSLEAVRALEDVAADIGISVAQLAIGWTLSHPAVHCAIVGVRNPRQIEQTAPAGDIQLNADDLERIDRVVRTVAPVSGPTPEGRAEAPEPA
jgi:aryl-alcohol dehydrogenase-like predicted oxidoreductase